MTVEAVWVQCGTPVRRCVSDAKVKTKIEKIPEYSLKIPSFPFLVIDHAIDYLSSSGAEGVSL